MPGVQASRKFSQPRGPRCLFLHGIPLLQPHLTDAAGPAFPRTSVPPCTVLGLCPPCTLKHTHADPRTHSYTCILTHAHSHAPSPEVLLARRTPPLHSWGWTSQTRLTWGLTAGLRRREGVSVGLRLCTLLASRVGGTRGISVAVANSVFGSDAGQARVRADRIANIHSSAVPSLLQVPCCPHSQSSPRAWDTAGSGDAWCVAVRGPGAQLCRARHAVHSDRAAGLQQAPGDLSRGTQAWQPRPSGPPPNRTRSVGL